MSPAAVYFFVVLATQAFFTAGLMWIVARRIPRRAQIYRFVAPAAVPILLFLIVSMSYVQGMKAQGVTMDTIATAPIAQFFLAYAILWLIGVLLASAVIRWTRR
jgi:hypothetical protein